LYKHLYKRYFDNNKNRLHFVAHSHHPWPDVCWNAAMEAMSDSMILLDRKWGRIMGEIVPEAQGNIARLIGHRQGSRIAFAPNTHEFVCRLYSCLPKDPHILTTDGEFHSFARQTRRFEEARLIDVTRVATQPFDTFEARFAEALEEQNYDMVFLSQVFFNSGMVVGKLSELLDKVLDSRYHGLVVIDGYHAAGAFPLQLSQDVLDKAFFLGGSYKYLQAGEGACFLSVPKDCKLRPKNTGWFAEFGTLSEERQQGVVYAEGGSRFWGATFDYMPLYRLNAVFKLWRDQGLTQANMTSYVQQLMNHFMMRVRKEEKLVWLLNALVTPLGLGKARARFLAFDLEDAKSLNQFLQHHSVDVDVRGTIVRFGFGIYHNQEDVDQLISILMDYTN
jgi:selenocysteine lyase/cysteine desulfurase